MPERQRPITLSSLRAESRIAFTPLAVSGTIPGSEIIPTLQSAFAKQNLVIQITELPADGNIAKDENKRTIPSHWPRNVSKSQLEALMFMSAGFTKLEIGQLEKPLKRNGSAMSLIAALAHEVPYMSGDPFSPSSSGTVPFWEVYGIEDNGNAHFLATQY